MGRRFPGGGGGTGGGGSGGGGTTVDPLHDGTPVSSIDLFDRTGSDDRKPYGYTAGMFPGASPNGNIKSRNVFATWAQWYDNANSHTGFTISSFSVNRSTGAITVLQSGPQDVWTNTSYSGISTTYLVHDAVHGCFFSGGHNIYPGQSSHQFGYTAGQVATDGSVNGGTNSHSNADHGHNGTYCTGLNQGSGSNYFLSAGYDAGNGSVGSYRILEAQSTGITIGSVVNNGSWTSSTGLYDHCWSPDTEVASGEAEAMSGTSFNSPDYGFNVCRAGSVTTQVQVGGTSYGQVYTGASGVTFMHLADDFYGTIGNGSNSLTSLVDGTRDMGSHMADNGSTVRTVGIGQNKVLFFRPGNSAFGGNQYCELMGFESNQNPKKLAHLSLGGATDKSVLDTAASKQCYYVVFENDNDTYPRWLVSSTETSKRHVRIEVHDMTADFASYTI